MPQQAPRLFPPNISRSVCFHCCVLGYKIFFRTKFVNPAKADIHTGRLPLTEDIAFWDKYYAALPIIQADFDLCDLLDVLNLHRILLGVEFDGFLCY